MHLFLRAYGCKETTGPSWLFLFLWLTCGCLWPSRLPRMLYLGLHLVLFFSPFSSHRQYTHSFLLLRAHSQATHIPCLNLSFWNPGMIIMTNKFRVFYKMLWKNTNHLLAHQYILTVLNYFFQTLCSCLCHSHRRAWWNQLNASARPSAHLCEPVQFSHSVMSDSLQPQGLQHSRPPCPSPAPGVHSNSCPSSWWCHPIISSSVVPFSCLQSFPASGFFPRSQFFTSGSQNIGVSASASVLLMNIQDWSPLGWTGWISL